MEQSSASGANSTENAGKQKQRDKRTGIKNMTEMYNNIPAPDYMKQLAHNYWHGSKSCTFVK